MPRGPRSGCWGAVFTDWTWPRALWAPRSGRPTLHQVLEVLSLDLTDPGADTGAEASSSLGSPPVQPMELGQVRLGNPPGWLLGTPSPLTRVHVYAHHLYQHAYPSVHLRVCRIAPMVSGGWENGGI